MNCDRIDRISRIQSYFQYEPFGGVVNTISGGRGIAPDS